MVRAIFGINHPSDFWKFWNFPRFIRPPKHVTNYSLISFICLLKSTNWIFKFLEQKPYAENIQGIRIPQPQSLLAIIMNSCIFKDAESTKPSEWENFFVSYWAVKNGQNIHFVKSVQIQSISGPNRGKYGPEKVPYLVTFYAKYSEIFTYQFCIFHYKL